MAAATKDSIAYLLKTLFKKGTAEYEAYKDRPLLAMLPKNSNARGRMLSYPVTYADPSGVSNTFASSQTAQNSSAGDTFDVTKVKLYGTARMEFEAIEDSKGDDAAYMELVKNQMNGMINHVSDRAEIQLYRDGSGAIGQRSSASGNVITLTSAGDVHLFKINSIITAAATKTGALKAGSAKVTAINRSGPTVTVDNAAGISGFADSDYLFPLGDAQNGATNPVAISGLAAWIPTTAPSATEFFGMNRTTDVEMLAGHRVNVAGANLQEGLIELAETLASVGSKPDLFLMSTTDYKSLTKLTQGQATYDLMSPKDQGKISFKAFQLNYSKGSAGVLADPYCPSGIAYGLQTDTWEIISAGTFPRIFNEAGDPKLTVSDADQAEIRSNNYINLRCLFPFHNGVAVNLGS